MKATQISDEQVTAHLNRPFNPPPKTDESFGAEWWSVLERVDDTVARFGKRDDAGYADYCLGTDWTFSRAIAVTVTAKSFLTVAVLEELQQLLRQSPVEYEIYLTHFMENEGKWDVFLSRDECLIFGEPLESNEQLQIEPAAT